MVIRACLVAIDWNSNINRPQKLSPSGQPCYKEKVCNRLSSSCLFTCVARLTGLVNARELCQSECPRTPAGRMLCLTTV